MPKRKRDESPQEVPDVDAHDSGASHGDPTPGIEGDLTTFKPYHSSSIDEEKEAVYRLKQIPRYRNLSCQMEGVVMGAGLKAADMFKFWPYNFTKGGASSSK